jgi:TPR repeat protein
VLKKNRHRLSLCTHRVANGIHREDKFNFGWPQDYKKASELLSHAAELGQSDGHFNLGILYNTRAYVACDPKKSLYNKKQAAMLDNEWVIHNLVVRLRQLVLATNHFKIAYQVGLNMQKTYLWIVQSIQRRHTV